MVEVLKVEFWMDTRVALQSWILGQHAKMVQKFMEVIAILGGPEIKDFELF